MKRNLPFLVVIIIVDLLPLYAVVEHGWNVIDAVFLFFIETAILAFFAVLRMRRASSNFVSRQADKVVEVASQKVRFVDRLRDVEVPGSKFIGGSFKTIFIVVFVLISIPAAFGELALLTWIANLDYFSTDEHEVAGVSAFWWILAIFFLEHFFTYWRRYVNDMEYLRTGVLNEGIAISFRILFQQIIIVIALILAVSNALSRFAAIVLFSTKLLLDIVAFFVNRRKETAPKSEADEAESS